MNMKEIKCDGQFNPKGPCGPIYSVCKAEEPPIQNGLSHLEKEVASVANLLSELRNRLYIVIRNEPANPNDLSEGSVPESNLLVDRIGRIHTKMCKSRDEIQDILRLLEL